MSLKKFFGAHIRYLSFALSYNLFLKSDIRLLHFFVTSFIIVAAITIIVIIIIVLVLLSLSLFLRLSSFNTSTFVKKTFYFIIAHI